MTLTEISTLYRYNTWAHERLFAIIEAMDPAEYLKDRGSSHGGIHGTLAHCMGAEDIWIRRWRGETVTSIRNAGDFASFAALRAEWKAVTNAIDAFIGSMRADGDLQRVVAYKDLKGNPYSQELGHLMNHLINHSTYHRGQIVTMLRQAGVKPVGTDLVAFYRELAAK